EHPRHRPGLGHVAAEAGEDVADLAGGAVAVVGERVDHDGHPAGTIALVAQLLVRRATALTGPALDGTVDIVGRHVDRAGTLDRQPQPEVGRRVTPALLGRHRDLTGHLGEDGPALGVGDRLLVL